MFEKRWSDEQKNEFLSVSPKDKNSIEELAKKYNLSPEKALKKIYEFRYADKQMKKKRKKQLFKELKSELKTPQSPEMPRKSEPEKMAPPASTQKIEVSAAPINPEAEEMRQFYLNMDGEVEKEKTPEDPEGEKETEEPVEVEEKRSYVKHSDRVDWTGTDDIVIFILEQRFDAFNKKHGKEILKPFSDPEKAQLKRGITECLEKRARFLTEYADLINLGLALFLTLAPRIFQAIDYNKSSKETPVKAPNEEKKEPEQPKIIQNPISDAEREKQRAIEEFQKIKIQ